jgi:murein L,D-transpeptidase YcbB/YkuD
MLRFVSGSAREKMFRDQRRRGRVARGATAIAVTLLVACASETPGEIPSVQAPATTATLADSSLWLEDAEGELASDFAKVYSRYIEVHLADQPLGTVLLGEEEPHRIQRRRFLAHLYNARDFRPALTTARGLTPVGEQLVSLLSEVEQHALEVEDYIRPELADALSAQAQLAHALQASPLAEPTDDEIDTLISSVEDAADETTADAAVAVLALALDAESAENSIVPELWRVHRQRLDLERAARGNGAIIEAILMDGYLAFAFDQQNFNTTWVNEDLDDDARHQLIADRTQATFQALVDATDPAQVSEQFLALAPPHPQYPLLLAERARYTEIVANGGWATIEPRHIERGSSGSTVTELQTRLAAESYFEGEQDGVAGPALLDAIRAYQETHQMELTGESSRGFWNSINVPAETRLAQIELTMQRWRESRIGPDQYYVFVNVPDFHAEVWRNGERAMRFSIVVGNTTQECDTRTGRLRYANATPVQSAEMTYVVLNPTWNVPQRIVEEELLPNLLENPLHFEENGFERVVTESGYEHVRQLPGPENPLGRVKFMFPNPHSTYMHDTSRPQYFEYPVRAFSHGCMRVSQPEDLLEYILTTDGQWDPNRVERTFERGVETSMTLNEAIPVHVEYFVVRVDDSGRANFLADIYRYDRDRLNPPSPSSLRCTPETETHRLVLGEMEQVLFRDLEGNDYTPEQWEYVQAGGVLEQNEDGTFAEPPEGAALVGEEAPDGVGTPDGEPAGGAEEDPTAGDLGP